MLNAEEKWAMKIVTTTAEEAPIAISLDDLGFLQDAINETIEALSDREIKVRTGRTADEAQELIDRIKAIRNALRNYGQTYYRSETRRYGPSLACHRCSI